MKIRNPHLIRAAGWLGTQVVRALVRSLRFEYHALGPPVMPPQPEPEPRSIYLLWHETLLLPLTKYACPEVSTLVSSHADGQLLATVVRTLGLTPIFGSTNRGGMQAVREIIRDVSGCRHLAITPDGPRGPRRVVQPGAVYIAAKTGMTLAPLGVAYHRPWRVRSWDRFAIPKPCTRAKVVSGRTFTVPPKVRTEDLEQHARLVQAELDRLTRIAEYWAETNKFDDAVRAGDRTDH
ncbi:MAG: lysophospholipid acyltransferase family protein [Fimbriiglobus sp.]|nr:lysophospholipid acyltransferase family protein [Fimbriiglobus sp.]